MKITNTGRSFLESNIYAITINNLPSSSNQNAADITEFHQNEDPFSKFYNKIPFTPLNILMLINTAVYLLHKIPLLIGSSGSRIAELTDDYNQNKIDLDHYQARLNKYNEIDYRSNVITSVCMGIFFTIVLYKLLVYFYNRNN